MPTTSQIRTLWILGLLLLVGSFMSGCRRANLSLRTESQTPQPPAAYGDKDIPEREKFRGADVAANEVLFKLERCDSADEKAFLTDLTQFVREQISDDRAVVTQVVNACWFSVKSSEKTVDRLMESFVSIIANKVRSTKTGVPIPPVIDAEPNFVIKLDPEQSNQALNADCPDDDLFEKGKLWGLNNLKHPGIDIDAVLAWNISKGSPDIVTGVVDTGLSYSHLDLEDNVWKAPDKYDIKIGSEVISCDALTHGYNALAATREQKCDPIEKIGTRAHGTIIAGIIGAVGGNHKGVVGVNWSASLIGLRFIGASGGEVADAARAIEFAIQVRKRFGAKANIRVLNASWGIGAKDQVSGTDLSLLKETIERAGKEDEGILFVASAGQNSADNDIVKHYPSGFPLDNVISVTAIDNEGKLAKLSGTLANTGSQSVHLSAPGVGIYSTYAVSHGYCYYEDSGTSVAAPFVSGAAALILSVQKCSALSASELKGAILSGAKPILAPIPTATGGMLSVYRSIEQCQ